MNKVAAFIQVQVLCQVAHLEILHVLVAFLVLLRVASQREAAVGVQQLLAVVVYHQASYPAVFHQVTIQTHAVYHVCFYPPHIQALVVQALSRLQAIIVFLQAVAVTVVQQVRFPATLVPVVHLRAVNQAVLQVALNLLPTKTIVAQAANRVLVLAAAPQHIPAIVVHLVGNGAVGRHHLLLKAPNQVKLFLPPLLNPF